MAKRFRAKKNQDRRMFSQTAMHVNGRNTNAKPLRGGYRL